MILNKKILNYKDDFYCLNYLNSIRTENKLKSHKNLCKNNDFCETVMALWINGILKFNQYMKSDKMPYIIYTDLEFLIKKKKDGCANNAESSSTTKIGEQIPCGYSI